VPVWHVEQHDASPHDVEHDESPHAEHVAHDEASPHVAHVEQDEQPHVAHEESAHVAQVEHDEQPHVAHDEASPHVAQDAPQHDAPESQGGPAPQPPADDAFALTPHGWSGQPLETTWSRPPSTSTKTSLARQ